MRYRINFDKTINQLVPYYLGGRRLILFLQACVKPLQKLNDAFVEYAKEQRIEASMTSQIFKLEWFLNRKFSKYFEDPVSLISIKNGEKTGVPIYNESATGISDDEEFKLWQETEGQPGPAFFYENDQTLGSSHSFIVSVPKLRQLEDETGKPTGQFVDGMTITQFESMLSYWVDRYKISGKTYKIIINQ